jgi:hypothetical protein
MRSDRGNESGRAVDERHYSTPEACQIAIGAMQLTPMPTRYSGPRGDRRHLEGVAVMIPMFGGCPVWIATGHTDMRRGMRGLALQDLPSSLKMLDCGERRRQNLNKKDRRVRSPQVPFAFPPARLGRNENAQPLGTMYTRLHLPGISESAPRAAHEPVSCRLITAPAR